MTSTVDTYLTAWLHTATKGNVKYYRALYADRYHFDCHVCQASLTVPSAGVDIVKNGIDYTLQQFVQIHAHVGGHVGYYANPTYPKPNWGDYQEMNPLPSTTGKTSYTATYYPPGPDKYTAAPTPVTIDFKKVKPKNLKLSTGRKFR